MKALRTEPIRWPRRRPIRPFRARRLPALVSAALLLAALAASAHAEGPAIAGRAGTLGIGPEVTFELARALHLRAGVFAVDYDDTFTERGLTYDGDLELRNGTVLLDWYPGAGGFRLSAGAAWNDSELVGTTPLEDFVRREVPTLPPLGFDLGTLRGTATVDPVAPYFGIGFGNPFAGGRWGFTIDLGVIHHGKPDVDLVADTDFPISSIPGGQEDLDAALAEEEAALEKEVDQYELMPVLSIGFTFAF